MALDGSDLRFKVAPCKDNFRLVLDVLPTILRECRAKALAFRRVLLEKGRYLRVLLRQLGEVILDFVGYLRRGAGVLGWLALRSLKLRETLFKGFTLGALLVQPSQHGIVAVGLLLQCLDVIASG